MLPENLLCCRERLTNLAGAFPPADHERAGMGGTQAAPFNQVHSKGHRSTWLSR